METVLWGGGGGVPSNNPKGSASEIGRRQTHFLFIQFTNCSACLGKASVGNAKQPISLTTSPFVSRSGTITRLFVFSKRERLNA